MWGRCTGDWVIEQVRDLAAGNVSPPAGAAFFEAEDEYPRAGSTQGRGRATRPTLTISDGELRGAWSAPSGVLPAFGPDPWILVEELDGDQWAPVFLGSIPVTDQTRAMFVERGQEGEIAMWQFRYAVPAVLRGRTLRFRLTALGFALAAEDAASNAVRLD